jgi:replicative DNA helicase
MKIDLEQTIIRNLLTNEDYMRKVIPFIKKEYFEGTYRLVFSEIVRFVGKYNKLPTIEAFKIEIDQSEKFNEQSYAHALDILPNIFERKDENDQWLIDTTEKWCQDRAVYLAVMESISILDGKHEKYTKEALPSILQEALALSFDVSVGHDYLENIDERFAFYHEQEERIPFDLDYFNKITKGGLPNKTLNVALAGTGVGKSLFMCHVAANALTQGKNVLYITLEMAEERIAERIDANLLNVPIDQLESLSQSMFKDRIKKIAESTQGKLIIKEYPTGQAHSGHFRALLNELKLKRRFIPELIFIDYLNICASSRVKGMGGAINSYSYVKAIAEEIRGLAVEFNVPIVSATQTTRSGFTNSDPGLEDTSESFGLPATADFMFALVSNEELSNLGQIMVKQLKNRYNDPTMHKRFVIGVDRSKMKLYDVEQEQQSLVDDEIPVFDKSSVGDRLKGIRIS